jgi:hypothetical protein
MADYQVTFTLNSAFTGTTEADSFTIVGKHANGSPADTTVATGVSKADLTAGVTYTVVDTITGGTITSTGTCTNSVPWTGLEAVSPTPTATGPSEGPTPTPNEELNTYYISNARFSLNDFCDGTIFSTTTAIQSTANTIAGLLNTAIYDEFGDPYVGNASRWHLVATDLGVGPDMTPAKYVVINNLGQCTDAGQVSCSGDEGSANPY